MTKSEFEIGMTLLKNVYGHAKYSEDRTFYFYKIFEPIDGNIWADKIKHFCAVSDKAPLLNELKELFKAELENHIDQKVKKVTERLQSCVRCQNSGVQTYYLKENGNSFAFQCVCEFGKLLRPNFPKQYPDLLKTHFNHKQWIELQNELDKNEKQNSKNYGNLKPANFSNLSEINH